MPLFASEDPRPIHFMGIAGAGMSALALLARRRGVAVTGCDIDVAGAGDAATVGAQILAGHDPRHVADARAVVYTAAVPPGHPELRAAREAGIPVVRRADALQEAIAHGTVVAVGGTHGKTTTAVMATEALAAAGMRPTGLVGGRVAAWGGNARLDGDALFVVEADEYDRAFLSLRPGVAVVNNVEADHLDCYGSVEVLEDAFADFAGRAGRVLVGADDAGARRIGHRVAGTVWTVGTAEGANIRVSGVALDAEGTSAIVAVPSGESVRLRLRVPGLHNVRNAAMALGIVAVLDGDVARAAERLREFQGVGRRFELVGQVGEVVVVDDYAHHPTEVAVTLAAARQRYPERRVVAVFQPHLYSRTAAHGDALGVALSLADLVVVTEIYAAREQPVRGVTGLSVEKAARRAGAETVWVPGRDELPARLGGLVEPGDLVLTLGAGDITAVGPALLRHLRERAA